MSPPLSGSGYGEENSISVTVRTETELRPYVGIFAVLLFWYLQKVSVDTTNNSDTVFSEITIRFRGKPDSDGCEPIDEKFVIPRLGPHDTDTRVFRYKRKADCPYSFSTEVVSSR
jgi:hypothetical protein